MFISPSWYWDPVWLEPVALCMLPVIEFIYASRFGTLYEYITIYEHIYRYVGLNIGHLFSSVSELDYC